MLMLMLSILIAILVVGTAALVGHPLVVLAVGALLAAAVLLRGRSRA